MANAAVDWTVDKLLSQFQTINQKAQAELARLKANRARYTTTLNSLKAMPEGAQKTAIRAQLTTWIHNQVDAENRFNDYAAKWASVKKGVADFLRSVNITPPSYLGVIQLAPVALVTLLLAAGAIITWLVVANNSQSKSLDGIQQVIALAQQEGWTPEQTAAALKQYRDAAAAATGDPFGITRALQAALPVLLVIAAVVLIPKLMPRRAGA